MASRESAARMLEAIPVPPVEDWAALYDRTLSSDCLPYPLGALLERLLALRDAPADFLMVAEWFHEVAHRFLAAVLAPPLLTHTRPRVGLEEALGRVLHGRQRRGLTFGEWVWLARACLKATFESVAAVRALPPFLLELERRRQELQALGDAAVGYRNAAKHGTRDGAVTLAEARLYERSVVQAVQLLGATGEYALLLRSPTRRVDGRGGVTPVDLPGGPGKAHLVELAQWRDDRLLDRWPLHPWLVVDTPADTPRALLLSWVEGGGTTARAHYQPALRLEGAAEDEVTVESGPWLKALVSRRGRIGPSQNEPARARIEAWTVALDQHFDGHARVLGALDGPPRLECMGEYRPTPEIERDAATRKPPVDDRHALLFAAPVVTGGEVNFHYETTWYRVIQALRHVGEKPRVLSASGVWVSPEERQLVLHRRSAGSSTYPECLHTLGGGFMPPTPDGTDHRNADRDLEDTVLREAREESLEWPRAVPAPMVVCEETTTGFVQCVFLGLPIGTSRLGGNIEGRALCLRFDELEPWLLRARGWVPSGKLHVLLWLAAGAPGCPGARFGDRGPEALLRHVLEQSARDYELPRIQPDA